MNHVIFNDVDLTTFGLYVSGDKTFDSPEKNYTKVSIPGRSGDLYIWDGTYKNVKLKYDAILIPPNGKTFSEAAADLRNFLLSVDGYGRIEDDYNPDEYRMGVYSGPISFKPERFIAGTTSLEFDCMPQRWLISGILPVNIHHEDQITNPTLNVSKPLLKIPSNSSSNVEISAAGMSITVKKRSFLVYIDCETMDCYTISQGSKIPKNDLIEVPNEFISLPPGTSTFEITGMDMISVTPRWFML